jgi:hypothetical protein
MVFPATLDYAQSFLTDALGAPIESYTSVSAAIKLVKVSASSFKDRTARAPPASSSDDSSSSRKERRTSRDKKSRGDSTTKEAEGSSRESSTQQEAEDYDYGSAPGSPSQPADVDEDAEVIEL